MSTAPTGGFGHKPAEWRWFTLASPLELTAGTYTLRLGTVTGDGNLDCFALFRK